jgi:hypothetical protein
MRIAIAAWLLLWAVAAGAQPMEMRWADPRLAWRTLETEHFLVHFAEQYREQARTAAAVAEKVFPRTTQRLNWTPRGRVHVVILHSADFANGFASPIPYNFAGIFLSPPDEGELLQNREWLELVISHELYHIVHLDKATGSPLSLRGVLGRFLLLFPNTLQPTWVIEGLAVDAESDAARGYGRLGQSHFEGMMRAETARGLRSLAEVNAEGRGFPLNRDYLYGSYFFLYLRERHGEKAAGDLIERYSKNLVPFQMDETSRAATGKTMDALWLDYQAWLRARFAPAGIAAEGELVAKDFSISSPVLTPSGERWSIQHDGYTRPRLMRGARKVREVEQDTRLAAAGEGVLVSELDVCRNYNLLYGLYALDASGARKSLADCDRYRLAAQLGDGRIAAVRADGGVAEVVIDKSVVYRGAPGESLTGIAARGSRVVVTSLRHDVWSLVDITSGKVLASDAAVKHSPRFGASDDEIFFVADYGKVYNLWSLRGGELRRWTQAANGVREISAPVGGEVLLTTIEADGTALRSYRLPASPLETRQSTVAAPVSPGRVETVERKESDYSPLQSLKPTSWLPLIQAGDGAFAIGALVYGTDALRRHEYLLGPMIELTQGELLGQAQYVYDGRHGVLLDRTLTVQSSDDDKIQAYTVHESAQWVSLWRHLKLDRRLYWGLGAALEQETFHQMDSSSARTQDERVVGLVAGYDSRHNQWLSEGPSQGQDLRLFAETSSGLGGAYSGNAYRADWRAHIPVLKTVLALRWNEAYAQPDAEPFEVGGSKTDEVTLLPVINQRDLPLRGYTTGTPGLIGERARTLTAEWRMPLRDIDRHWVSPPLGMNRLSMNLFMDVGAAWQRGASPDYRRGFGVEFMVEPRFGYVFGLQARAGVARGIDEGGSTRWYLRVGRSF